MNWRTHNEAHMSGPYTIRSVIHGYEIWLNYEGHFGVLSREQPTLEKAKERCEMHAHEVIQRQQLQAVFVK